MNNLNRVARATSSNAHKLIKLDAKGNFQKPGLTYLEEKIIEKRMQCCLDASGAYSQALAWGNFMEFVIYSLLGVEYAISSKETFLHPIFGKFWSGSADLIIKNLLIGEIKCYQKKKFAQYTDCLIKPITKFFTLEDKIANLKKLFPQEYWQMVSNAAIHEVKIAEAITYMPFESEAESIRGLAEDYEGEDKWKYRFIYEKPIEQLPFLKNDGYYNNINKFRFEVPQADFDLLENRMLKFGSMIKNAS